MRSHATHSRNTHSRMRAWTGALAGALVLAACGGSGNPLDNPASVQNPPASSGNRLSFLYFQRCVNPVFLAALPVTVNGSPALKTCAAAGCHDSAYGTGGAFRIIPSAATVDLATNTPDLVRASNMYRNFISAQAETSIGAPGASLLLEKPLLQGVLHGGGQVFADGNDANAKRISYWITNPMPAGQDELSPAGNNLFTPADANTGTCNG
jgi:hypothetical protein